MKLLLFFIIIVITFFLLNLKKKEHFTFPKLQVDNVFNGKKVITSGANKVYFQKPKGYNTNPLTLNNFGVEGQHIKFTKNNDFLRWYYALTLFNLKKMNDNVSKIINKKEMKSYNKNIFTGKKLSKDKMNIFLYNLNLKTWPITKQIFEYSDYKQINSYIDEVNTINNKFIKKFNYFQNKSLENNNEFLILAGNINYIILKFKILSIAEYKNIKIFSILYLLDNVSTFLSLIYIKAFVYKGKVYIFDTNKVNYRLDSGIQFIGSSLYNNKYNYIGENNKILTNSLEKVNKLRNQHKDDFKLKNQSACFNINFNIDKNIIPKNNKYDCENYSFVDNKIGQGIWEKPCKKDSECLFYKSNKNYDNTYGKCLKSGFCEVPSNMENLGYKYYKPIYSKRPLCYNCESKVWKPSTDLGFCCNEQEHNKKKYSFLKSPDYAFENDYTTRMNHYYKKNCYIKSGKMYCNKLIK